MEYVNRRVIELAPAREAAMDAFNRGLGKGAGNIIQQIGREADILFPNH
jgi:hypothetical protein